MSRDYAKRNTFRKKSKKSRPFPWLILLLLFAAFIYILALPSKYKEYGRELLIKHLTTTKKTIQSKQAAVKEVAAKNVVTKEAAIEEAMTKEIITKTDTTPKFDFYNILPQKKESKTHKPEMAYELGIATVDDFAAADRLKAELALLGFAASITPTYQHNIQKYYVSVGPYNDKDGAITNQKKLKTSGVKSEIKKVR